jgi:uncharacterized protein (TIGR04168 family)
LTAIAVFGDLHGSFDHEDALATDAAGLDGVVFVGDLGGGARGEVPACAAAIASLRTPAWWVPGNHDGVTFPQLAAEIVGVPGAGALLDGGMEARAQALVAALQPARLVAWERWEVAGLSVIAGRPHSLGGPSFAFASWTRRRWGIDTLEASAARLCALIDEVPSGAPVLLVAHNGPAGCGAGRADPFGRDFDRRQGDWGDPDLRVAVDHARAGGRPMVVVAGHMHHGLRGGGERRTVHLEDGVIIVNAAVVPRIERGGVRHHVEVRVEDGGLAVTAVRLLRGARDVRQIGALRRDGV